MVTDKLKGARDRCSMGGKSAKNQEEEGRSGNTPHSLRRVIAFSSTQDERASQDISLTKAGVPS